MKEVVALIGEARHRGVNVQANVYLRLEAPVRKMTSLDASKIGLRDRGMLLAGWCADITLFDANRIVDGETYEEPFRYNPGSSTSS